MRGKAQDGFRVESAGQAAGGQQCGVERFGGLVICDQDEAGRVRGADEERKIECAGGEGEAGSASSPAAGAQMATDTVEGNRVLKVRKQFADERQNHAVISLPSSTALVGPTAISSRNGINGTDSSGQFSNRML